jgi:hypothetical protein
MYGICTRTECGFDEPMGRKARKQPIENELSTSSRDSPVLFSLPGVTSVTYWPRPFVTNNVLRRVKHNATGRAHGSIWLLHEI